MEGRQRLGRELLAEEHLCQLAGDHKGDGTLVWDIRDDGTPVWDIRNDRIPSQDPGPLLSRVDPQRF